MTNFLLIYHDDSVDNNKEERQRIMVAWDGWMKQCGENLVDAGNPFSNAVSVTKDGTKDYSGNEKITGYSVIKADSMESAVKAATMVPLVVDGSGTVDVYETFDPMAMQK
jgi:hypothetical protein